MLFKMLFYWLIRPSIQLLSPSITVNLSLYNVCGKEQTIECALFHQGYMQH